MHQKLVFTVFFLRLVRCLGLPNRIGLSIPQELHSALLPGPGFANNTEGGLEKLSLSLQYGVAHEKFLLTYQTYAA